MTANEPKISIVIPAHNEESTIGDCIKGILSQEYGNKEVIVINDGSKDRTSEIAKSLNVKVIDFDKGHSAAYARNAGARKATGDVLYFLDADVLIKDKSFLSKLAQDFVEADAVSYRIVPEKPKTFIQKCLNIPYSKLPFSSEKKILTNRPEQDTVRGFQAVKRKVFLELGGFNEKVFYFEDRELHSKFYSKGYKALYDPGLVMYSIEPENWNEFVRQSRWTGRGVYEYYKQTGILHYKAILFWLLYLLFGVSSIFILPLPLFLFMNLILLAWILKMIYKSRDVVHSIGYVFFHFCRTLIVLTQFLKLSLFGGGGR